ncbi:CPBP family intramembrane glutamic endopeptidase [Defluviimonas sp. SAOS-178_SWC]|uniref:CPBP family intramembrane glutamic endopeptidase n=1 Tax=Defluviimonas sp. SAOS-178_SWC TaxID=3121287 RepID=UPI0032213B01
MPDAYAPHDAYIAPARRRREFWRLFPGAAIILAVYLGPIVFLGIYLTETYGRLITGALMQRMARGDTPGGMLMLLWTFLGLALGPMVAVRLLHGRAAGTLFGPSLSRALADFTRVLGPVLALNGILLPFALGSESAHPGLGFADFLSYLPFALPGILIQTGAEELVFRGYLQQQLAARFKSPLIWIGLPSALFAFGHYLPDEFGTSAWAVALWAAVFGVLAADLTARTGNLGAALGLHFANNIAALLFVGLENNLDGLALWTMSIDLADPSAVLPALAVDFAAMITSWLLARLVLRV